MWSTLPPVPASTEVHTFIALPGVAYADVGALDFCQIYKIAVIEFVKMLISAGHRDSLTFTAGELRRLVAIR